MVSPDMEQRRRIHGVWFTCDRPGCWLSDDGWFGIYHMLADTVHQQWEMHRASKANGDPLEGDLVSYHFTLGELIADVAEGQPVDTR